MSHQLEIAEKKKKMAVAFVIVQQHMSNCAHFLSISKLSDRVEVVSKVNYNHFASSVTAILQQDLTKFYFGFDKTQFSVLVDLCGVSTCGTPPAVKVAVFLKYLREGRSQNKMARDIGISQPSISRLIRDLTYSLCNVATTFIKFPSTRQEIESKEASFRNLKDRHNKKRNIPCFGALDGKHFAIEHPPNSGSLNANYKGFFSFNTLFVCDANLRILYCQISELGVNSDAQMYRDGPLPAILQNTIQTCGYRIQDDFQTMLPPFLLADNGFALSYSVMQPYRQTQLSRENLIFNQKVSAVRVKIENLFGCLTSRYRIFRRDLNLDPPACRALVVAASVLHNMHIGKDTLLENQDDMLPRMTCPYRNVEEQRSALKQFIFDN